MIYHTLAHAGGRVWNFFGTLFGVPFLNSFPIDFGSFGGPFGNPKSSQQKPPTKKKGKRAKRGTCFSKGTGSAFKCKDLVQSVLQLASHVGKFANKCWQSFEHRPLKTFGHIKFKQDWFSDPQLDVSGPKRSLRGSTAPPTCPTEVPRAPSKAPKRLPKSILGALWAPPEINHYNIIKHQVFQPQPTK